MMAIVYSLCAAGTWNTYSCKGPCESPRRGPSGGSTWRPLVLLALLAAQDLVECVVLARVGVLLVEGYLVLLGVDIEEFLGVAVLLLVWQQGAHTDGNSDI